MSIRALQTEFRVPGFSKPKDCFGGSLLKSNPKTRRPLESKLPIHLVLRATRGGMRLPKVFAAIQNQVDRISRRHGVKIYQQANVGNHLHLLIKIPQLHTWPAFIRELTGQIASLMKAKGLSVAGEKFWRFRPFTRIVKGWQKAFRIAKEYVELNWLEAEGFISRKETKSLRDLRAIFTDG